MRPRERSWRCRVVLHVKGLVWSLVCGLAHAGRGRASPHGGGSLMSSVNAFYFVPGLLNRAAEGGREYPILCQSILLRAPVYMEELAEGD